MTNQGTMKQAIYETLSGVLSQDTNVRQQSEQQMKLFEVTEEYGTFLTEITLDTNVVWPVRQLSSVLLKQFIATHWSKSNDKFQPPEVLPEHKQRIRLLLLNDLCQDCDLTDTSPSKRLKSAVAYVVSTIAHYDWPEEWPDLFGVLVNSLSSGRKGAVYGAMKVFVDISHEVIDTQIPSVAPLLLPKMLEIFADSQNFSLRTRGRACQVFCYISETIAVMTEYDKVSAKMYLDPVLPHFTEALVKVLQLPDLGTYEVDVGLKKDVLNCLTVFLKHFRNRLRKWMPQILAPIWYSLTNSASLYVKTIINSEAEENIGVFDSPIDSDGEVLSLESLVFSLFDFLSILLENAKTRKMIKASLSDLIYYILIYMQISDEQMQAWSANPDQFVEDEDEDSYSYSVRLSAQEVFLSLATEFHENEPEADRDIFNVALIQAVSKHFNESNQLKQNPNNYFWWKVQESCLLAIGSLATSLVDVIKSEGPASSDLKAILDNVYVEDSNASPFFSGRCLWTAARFAPVMSPPVIDRFLQTTVRGLANQSHVYKICSVRATYAFVQYLNDTQQVSLLAPYLLEMSEGLVAMSVQFSNEVLALDLETLSILIDVDENFTANIEPKVSALAIGTFVKHAADPVLISICQDIFAALSKNPKTAPVLQQRLLPTLMSLLNPPQPNETTQTLQPVALDILTTMVKNSPLPLSDILMGQLFPAAANCILKAYDENASMQNGGECMRAYMTRSPQQVVAFKESDTNRDGLTIIMQVCMHLLDPRVNESCAAFVGRLVSVVITNAAPVLGHDNIHLLLRSVLSKLQTSETLSVVQSLIMVFAHLLNHEMQTVLDFLSSIPGPNGSQSALEFVLTQWLSRQHVFYGTYENKVCILALCKLLEYSVSNFNTDNSINLNIIQVPGEPIEATGQGIQTRSKTANLQWTSIPCSVKIVKLLLQEIRAIEEQRAGVVESDEEDDDEDDYEFDGSNQTGSDMNSSKERLQAFLDDYDGYEESEPDVDDVIDDELGKVNLEEYLGNFLRGFKTSPLFGEFHNQLDKVDSDTIARI